MWRANVIGQSGVNIFQTPQKVHLFVLAGIKTNRISLAFQASWPMRSVSLHKQYGTMKTDLVGALPVICSSQLLMRLV
jgi:hypothetical protein